MPKNPKFKTYLEESDYWDTVSLEELIATSEPVDAKFVDRRPRKAISLRMDEDLILETKAIAAKLRIGYQTLFRIWIREGLQKHHQRAQSAKTRKKGIAA